MTSKERDRGKDVGPTRAMASQAPSKPSAGDRRDLNKTQARLEKQVARAETEIADCETKIKARDLELADPALYKNESTKWSVLQTNTTDGRAILCGSPPGGNHSRLNWKRSNKS